MSTSDPATDAPKIPKGGALLANLPTENVLIKKGFNPRTDLGDLTDLKRNLKEHGILQPILVCPHPNRKDTYFVVCGHRRLTAWQELGKANVPVAIRPDLTIDSDEALALAVSENSPDGRTNLSPVDEAQAFKRLLDANGGEGNEVKVATAVGYSTVHVKRTLKLLSVPDSVRKRLVKGEISKMTAVAIADVPDELRDRVVSRVVMGTTEAEVSKMVNEARREAREAASASGAPAADAPASRHNRPVGTVPGQWTTPKAVREVRKMMEHLGADCLNAQVDMEESKDSPEAKALAEAAFTNKAYALAALLWQTGGLEKIDPGTKAFQAALNDIKQRFEDRDAAGKADSPVKEKSKPKAAPAAAKAVANDDE